MSAEDTEEDRRRAEVFDALSHPTRILILKALNEGSLGFAELKKKLGIESSGHLQHHLSKLGNLVKPDEYGKYALSDQGKDALLSVETVENVTRDTPKRNYKGVGFNPNILKSAVVALVLLLVATVAVAALQYNQNLALQNSLDESNKQISELIREQVNVPTTLSVTATPNVIFNDEPVTVQVLINPGPPTPNDRFTNYTFTVTLPDGTIKNITEYSSSSSISFGLGKNVIDNSFTFNDVTVNSTNHELHFIGEIGPWKLKVVFLGQTFGNGTYYMPSENETSFAALFMSIPPLTPSPPPTSPPN